MPPTQARILECLERAAGRAVSKQKLEDAIGREISAQQLRVQVCLLRTAIKSSGRNIKPRWGYGYRLTWEDGNGRDSDA